MTSAPTLTTPRLLLRSWRDEDRAPFAAMNADPNVMRYFHAPWTLAESDDAMARIVAGFAQRGFGFWAVEIPGITPFAGFVGLSVPSFEAPFVPCVEIGWRLASRYWHRGYATEGARAALSFGWRVLGLAEIVAFTVPANLPSRRVMDRIGMTRDLSGDFDHPRVPAGHVFRRHVLYRIAAPPGEDATS